MAQVGDEEGEMKTATLTLSTVLVVLATAGTAGAAKFLVDSKLDSVDANPGDGICDDGQGRCTLRAAILETNALPGADGIHLQKYGTPYFLTIPGAEEDLGYTGDLDITGELSITFNLRFQGPPQPAVIDGLELDRVFDIRPGASVTIQGVTIWHGQALEETGGAIRNLGTLTLVSTKVRDSVARAGGGIGNSGVLTLTESAVFGNSSIVRGGGIDNSGHLKTFRSQITDNHSQGKGGGIYLYGGSGGWLTNTTVSGNSADDEEVGIVVAGGGVFLRLDNCTVANHGIGIKAFGSFDRRTHEWYSGTVLLLNTIVAKNADKDCWIGPAGVINSVGHNLDSDGTCNLDFPGDKPGVDPLLAQLAWNGGPTWTHALLVYSPAVEGGNNFWCPFLDQRGFPRPYGVTCDIGAYEYGASASH
jgi:parallel beta-helix repeat protein